MLDISVSLNSTHIPRAWVITSFVITFKQIFAELVCPVELLSVSPESIEPASQVVANPSKLNKKKNKDPTGWLLFKQAYSFNTIASL